MKQCTNPACGYLEENDTAGFCGICGGELGRTGGLSADRWGEAVDEMEIERPAKRLTERLGYPPAPWRIGQGG